MAAPPVGYKKAPPLDATIITPSVAVETAPDAEHDDDDISELLAPELPIPPTHPELEPAPSFLCIRGPWAGARYTPIRCSKVDVPVSDAQGKGVYRFTELDRDGPSYHWISGDALAAWAKSHPQ